MIALVAFFSSLSGLAATTLVVTEGSVAVHVQAELRSGDDRVTSESLAELAGKWSWVAGEIWNQAPAFTWQGKPVRFEFDFQPRREGGRAEVHDIEVFHGVRNSAGFYSAYVAMVKDPRGPHEGVFPEQIEDDTLAHEVGHLMGLVDEYEAYDRAEAIPTELVLNGLRLVPATRRKVGEIWEISFGPLEGTSGIMGIHSTRVLEHQVARVLSSLGLGNQNQ